MFLHSQHRYRRNTAQSCAPRCQGLAARQQSGSVTCVGGKNFPASLTDHLFRTPSFTGQWRSFNARLPGIFSHQPACNRQRPAQNPLHEAKALHGRVGLGHLPSDAFKKQKGWAGCDLGPELQRWHSARALRPAAIPQPNRFSMGARPAWPDRPCWIQTLWQGPQQALLSMSSTVRKTRASARARPAQLQLINRPRTGPDETMQNAVPDRLVRGGVLRSCTRKTKDCSCSTRS